MSTEVDDVELEPDDSVPIEPPELLSTRIDPLHRLGLAIVLGTALALPSLAGAVGGRVSMAKAAWMFGVAVAVAWVMVWLVWAVWHMYRSQYDQATWDAWEQAESARLARVAEREEAERLAAEEAERLAAEEAERLAAEEAERLAAEPDAETEPEVVLDTPLDTGLDPDVLASQERQRLADEAQRLQAELDDLVVDPRPGLIPPTGRPGLRPRPVSLVDALGEAPDSAEALVPDALTESR